MHPLVPMVYFLGSDNTIFFHWWVPPTKFLNKTIVVYLFNSVQTSISIKIGQQLPCFKILSAKLSLLSVKILSHVQFMTRETVFQPFLVRYLQVQKKDTPFTVKLWHLENFRAVKNEWTLVWSLVSGRKQSLIKII